MHISTHIHTNTHIHSAFVWITIDPSTYLPVDRPISSYLSTSLCLSIYLPIDLSIHLSTHQPIYLYVYVCVPWYVSYKDSKAYEINAFNLSKVNNWTCADAAPSLSGPCGRRQSPKHCSAVLNIKACNVPVAELELNSLIGIPADPIPNLKRNGRELRKIAAK